jgi:hypothetical protein
LSNCANIGDASFALFRSLPKLNTIRAKDLPISSAALKTLANNLNTIYNLTYLNLEGSRLDALPHNFRQLSRLQVLKCAFLYISLSVLGRQFYVLTATLFAPPIGSRDVGQLEAEGSLQQVFASTILRPKTFKNSASPLAIVLLVGFDTSTKQMHYVNRSSQILCA